jgi:hypothetical protein
MLLGVVFPASGPLFGPIFNLTNQAVGAKMERIKQRKMQMKLKIIRSFKAASAGRKTGADAL